MLENAPLDFLKQQKRAEEAEKEAGFTGPSKSRWRRPGEEPCGCTGEEDEDEYGGR